MLESLTIASFQDRIGETFRIPIPDGEPLSLELIEAATCGGDAREGQRQPFSLVFRGPAELVLEQATHELEHAEMEGLALFLVPLGPDEQGMRYESVFT